MATTMFAVALSSPPVWTELVNGASHSSFGVQIESMQPLAVTVASAAPAVDNDNYIVLAQGLDRTLSLDLASGEKLYGRALNGPAKIRGYKVLR